MLVWGVPVFYMPYFSSPDSTVNKQTGLLAPAVRLRRNLGYGLSLPYFINLAPSYDLTLIPTYLSKQGFLGEVDWRQRLVERPVQHTHDRHRRAAAERCFPPTPMARATSGCAARSRPRATFFSTRTGSSAGTRHGCRTSSSPTTTNFRASISAITISRTSFRRSICAARPTTASSTSAPTTSRARRRTTTTAPCRPPSPVFDYNRVFALPADRTNGIGGEATVDVNIANIDQTNAAFQSTGLQTFDNAYHLYNVCETVVGDKFVNTYFPGQCMLRSIAGDYTRASGQVSWQRSYIDTIGEVWKPFVSPGSTARRPSSTKPGRSPTRVRSDQARSPTRARRPSSPAATKAPSLAAWRASDSNTAIPSP